jgi:hypothetical protein
VTKGVKDSSALCEVDRKRRILRGTISASIGTAAGVWASRFRYAREATTLDRHAAMLLRPADASNALPALLKAEQLPQGQRGEAAGEDVIPAFREP